MDNISCSEIRWDTLERFCSDDLRGNGNLLSDNFDIILFIIAFNTQSLVQGFLPEGCYFYAACGKRNLLLKLPFVDRFNVKKTSIVDFYIYTIRDCGRF